MIGEEKLATVPHGDAEGSETSEGYPIASILAVQHCAPIIQTKRSTQRSGKRTCRARERHRVLADCVAELQRSGANCNPDMQIVTEEPGISNVS